MYQITFQFENGGKPVIVDATPNTTILDAARQQTSPSTHPATATARAASAGSKFSRALSKARPRTTSRKKITPQAGA